MKAPQMHQLMQQWLKGFGKMPSSCCLVETSTTIELRPLFLLSRIFRNNRDLQIWLSSTWAHALLRKRFIFHTCSLQHVRPFSTGTGM